jgi:hypothetical protein
VSGADIDTLKEKVELYRDVKERLKRLKELAKESEAVALLPEIREFTSLALQLLEKIRAEREGRVSPEAAKEEAFREWLEPESG